MNAVTYDRTNNQLVINNLPFDGPDGRYDNRFTMANGARVYESRQTATTGLVKHYAVFIESDYMQATAAAGANWFAVRQRGGQHQPVRNNGYAANAVESFASNVVGDGIKPSSTIADAAKKEELQALWLAWTDDADAEGLTDFYGLQRRAAREVFLSGEVFIRIRPRRAEDGLTVPLQLQMLPAEMLPLDMHRTLPGAGLIRHGIEFDGIGRRVAYHFLRRHPGDLTDPGLAGETVRVPAGDVIHVLDPVEAGPAVVMVVIITRRIMGVVRGALQMLTDPFKCTSQVGFCSHAPVKLDPDRAPG